MEAVCYLCGESIPEGKSSKDHVVPHQLIARDQPIAKGFDYGGFLPTHEGCNNGFGGRTARTEDTWRTALQLGNVLHDENCFKHYQRVDKPELVISLLKEECLESFTKDDLEFFEIADVRGQNYNEWSSPPFWEGKKRVDVYEKPRNVILSVLAKSAAAILVKRSGVSPKAYWRIMATLVIGDNVSLAMDDFFKGARPFDVNLSIKATRTETGDWFVCYVVGRVAALFSSAVSEDNTWFDAVGEAFKD